MVQPKWRFKREDGASYPDWRKDKWLNLGQFISSGTLSKADLSEEGIPCILYGELYTKYREIAHTIYSKTNSKSHIFSKKDDVILPKSGETPEDISTATCIPYDNVSLGGDLIVFRHNEKVIGRFLSYLISNRAKSAIASIAQGKSVVHISEKGLANIELTFPCLEEQKKIADFLSAVDEVIAQSDVEVQNLEQQKKAVMQKIFSQEVRFRSEDGTEFPEWEEKAIEELCESILGGGTPTTDNKDYWNGDIAWVSSSDLDNNDIHHLSITRFITEEAIRCSATKKIPRDSVLIVSRVGVGKVVVAPCELCTSQDFTNIVNPKCNSLFLGYMLSIIMQIKANGAQGTSIKGVTAKEIKQYRLSIPCLEEQQKIADFFSAYDEAISYAKQELDKWKELKKGLLQQMFV